MHCFGPAFQVGCISRPGQHKQYFFFFSSDQRSRKRIDDGRRIGPVISQVARPNKKTMSRGWIVTMQYNHLRRQRDGWDTSFPLEGSGGIAGVAKEGT